MLLVVIFLAKLVGKDKPDEIADWAKNHAEELAKLLKLKREWMPSHSTIRRVFHSVLDEAEFDRMAQEYHQREQSKAGEVLAMDGKVNVCWRNKAWTARKTRLSLLHAPWNKCVWLEKSLLAMRCIPRRSPLNRL
jgi:hypothetical protein